MMTLAEENYLKAIFHLEYESGGEVSTNAIAEKMETKPSSVRSEEHTSELQSRPHLVCRLLLEKKKKITISHHGEQRSGWMGEGVIKHKQRLRIVCDDVLVVAARQRPLVGA